MMFQHTFHWHRWLIALALIALLALLAVAFMVGRVTRPDSADPAEAPHLTEPVDGDGDSATMYYCSMHPQIRSTDPDATCPICGMALVPMPADAERDDATDDVPVLRISERAARLLDIQTTPVERGAAEAEVRFAGRLAYDERRLSDIVARTGSYVEQLHANYAWAPVREGEPLAALHSPAVTAAGRELLVLARSANGERNPSALAAARARLTRLGVSPDQVDAMLEAGEPPHTYQVASPADGVVAELNAREGEWLDEGDRLLRVADLSTLWLELEAFEADLRWLRVGQRAQFTVPAYPEQTFDGTVAFINPVVDGRTRTAAVRVDVPNAQGRLMPGMFARGTVVASVGAAAGDAATGDDEAEPLLIPASAPLITGRRAIVYVRLPDTERPTFEGRQVVLGPRVGDRYVVREGLSEGEQVVTHGQFKLDSELQIRGRPSMMARAERFDAADEAGAETGVPSLRPAEQAEIDRYPLDVCIVTGLPLDSMGGPLAYEHEGRTILFCCDACPPRFEADPEQYLPKLDQAYEAREAPQAPSHQH